MPTFLFVAENSIIIQRDKIVRIFVKSISFLVMASMLGTSVSANLKLPNNYKTLEGCKKQEILWDEIKRTEHRGNPKLNKFGFFDLLGMFMQKLSKKTTVYSDVAEKGWKKYLHPYGSIAKVKIVPVEGHNYTGLFDGADCGLMRLSLTYRVTKKRPFAPGLALKILRDGSHSANVSALYAMEGQGENHNFFENPLSNIVPIGRSFGHKVVHAIFERISDYPEELLVNDFGEYGANGEKVSSPNFPRQIFFVPNENLKFDKKSHDYRKDLATIPTGTTVYKIYAAPDDRKDFNYYNYEIPDIEKFVEKSKYIGDIVTTSKFVASKFGDKRILFKHQTR